MQNDHASTDSVDDVPDIICKTNVFSLPVADGGSEVAIYHPDESNLHVSEKQLCAVASGYARNDPRGTRINLVISLNVIFLSSTFDNMTAERNYLTDIAFPYLKAECKKRSLDFNVVDLRWGVRDTATDAHDTIAICEKSFDRHDDQAFAGV